LKKENIVVRDPKQWDKFFDKRWYQLKDQDEHIEVHNEQKVK